MTTRRILVWATAALMGACSSDPSTSTQAETAATDQTGAGAGAATGTSTKPATGTTGAATATSGRGASTPSTGGAASPVATGNTATTAAGRGATTAAGTGAAPTTGSAGTAGRAMAADDSDAGVANDMMMAANGGRAAAAGSRAIAGSGAAGMGRAGTGGSRAAGTAGAGGVGGKAAGGTGGSTAELPMTAQVPTDTSKAGPWPVGVRTVNLQLGAGVTPVEVWYPAKLGSQGERKPVSYDVTAWLPPEHGIPTSAPKVHIDCDCYRELPPDTEHGPFPVVVIVHDQASFRAAFASQMSHWASRGFIAIAADHPGLLLRDALAGYGCTGSGMPQDVAHTRDLPALFRELGAPNGIFSFLKGAIDVQRVALGGHGAGAAYAADNGTQPGVKAMLSFSDDSAIRSVGQVAGSFFLSGMSDKIIAYNNVVRAYETTARNLRPTLLAGMANVGHLGFTDMCGARNSDGQDAIAVARRYDVCGGAAVNVADQYLWDCPLSPLAGADNYLDQAATTALVRKLSTLALEELLLGKAHTQDWNTLGADTTWGELRQTR